MRRCLMDKSPAVQWYAKDHLTSVRVAMMDLKTEGAYRRALDYCWLNGFLPNNLKKLCEVIGKGCTEKIAKVVYEMFEVHPDFPDRLVNERQEKERAKQANFRASRVENGKRGGRPKREPSDNLEKTYEKPTGFENESENEAKKSFPISYFLSPSPDIEKENIKEKPEGGETGEAQNQLFQVNNQEERKKGSAQKKKEVFTPPTIEQIVSVVDEQQRLKNLNWDTARCTSVAEDIFDHYENTKWTYGKSKTPISSLTSTVRQWIKRGMDRGDLKPTPIGASSQASKYPLGYVS